MPATRARANALSAAVCAAALGGSAADTVDGSPGTRCSESAANHDAWATASWFQSTTRTFEWVAAAVSIAWLTAWASTGG